MGDILERLRSRMVGHPHAKIPWPHRDLHDAADTISALRAENEALRKAHSEVIGVFHSRKTLYESDFACAVWMARKSSEAIGIDTPDE